VVKLKIKANLTGQQLAVSVFHERDYVKIYLFLGRKNKPKSKHVLSAVEWAKILDSLSLDLARDMLGGNERKDGY
jgi:hypothetical protein